jgi:hypothetical protein
MIKDFAVAHRAELLVCRMALVNLRTKSIGVHLALGGLCRGYAELGQEAAVVGLLPLG